MNKEYICGCGRVYGSYPAFSTHRKTKHQNQTIPGTQMPSQDKAKRGRPSYDFKKIPKPEISQKNSFQALTIIQYGLLDLEDQFKGKILSDPTTVIDFHLSDEFAELCSSAKTGSVVSGMVEFSKILTNHMTRIVAAATLDFMVKLVRFGEEESMINSMEMYNKYFGKNGEELKKSNLGLQFYIRICVIMTKWLQMMGYTTETLRIKEKKVACYEN